MQPRRRLPLDLDRLDAVIDRPPAAVEFIQHRRVYDRELIFIVQPRQERVSAHDQDVYHDRADKIRRPNRALEKQDGTADQHHAGRQNDVHPPGALPAGLIVFPAFDAVHGHSKAFHAPPPALN